MLVGWFVRSLVDTLVRWLDGWLIRSLVGCLEKKRTSVAIFPPPSCGYFSVPFPIFLSLTTISNIVNISCLPCRSLWRGGFTTVGWADPEPMDLGDGVAPNPRFDLAGTPSTSGGNDNSTSAEHPPLVQQRSEVRSGSISRASRGKRNRTESKEIVCPRSVLRSRYQHTNSNILGDLQGSSGLSGNGSSNRERRRSENALDALLDELQTFSPRSAESPSKK